MKNILCKMGIHMYVFVHSIKNVKCGDVKDVYECEKCDKVKEVKHIDVPKCC